MRRENETRFLLASRSTPRTRRAFLSRDVKIGRVVRKLETLAADAATLQAYLREIGKFQRLTADEEKDLGRRIRQHGDEDALRRLVESNLRFVVSYAKRYRHVGVPFLDLIHEGNLGLIEAARRFDPDRNVKFITYAVWWIRQAIMHLLSDSARVYSLPTKVSGAAARFGRQVAALKAQLEHAPSMREIADELDISESEAETLLRLQSDDVSLSDRVRSSGSDDGLELAETLADSAIPAVDDELTREALVQDLETALAELDPKERQVMRLRYGLQGGDPWTLQQIGDHLQLSRERIRQIESRAMQKLRRHKSLRSFLN
jgi:RNA polymerase primary sigma factor